MKQYHPSIFSPPHPKHNKHHNQFNDYMKQIHPSIFTPPTTNTTTSSTTT